MDGAAECPAELVLAKDAAGGREVVAGVQIGVAEEVEGVAVKCIAARFGDDADLAAAVLAVFGVVVAGDDAELGDGIEVGNDGRAGVHILFRIAAVHAEIIRRFALAVDGKIARVQRAGGVQDRCPDILHRRRSDRRGGSDAGLQRKQVGVAASVQRNSGHLPPPNHLARLRVGGLDMQRVVGHGHRLVNRPRLEHHVDGERGVRVENDAAAEIDFETGRLGPELVAADRQDRQRVETPAVGLYGVREPGIDLLKRHAGVGKHAARCIGDGA